MSRLETPHTPVSLLVCDRFRHGPSYTNWRPKGSQDWLLIHTDAGVGEFKTPLGTLMAPPGSVVLYAPGELQDYQTASSASHWELTWVHFQLRQHWGSLLNWPYHENGVRYLYLEGNESHASFQEALTRTREFSRRTLPRALDFAANALEEVLLWGNVVASEIKTLAPDPRVRQAADYLSAHLSEPFQLEKLAAHCCLSVSRLSHLFKAQLGITPQQFLESQRMQHACHLLRLTGLSIADVAHEVGYTDPFYFSNRFRRSFGQSPLRFRNNSKA